MKMIVSDLDGTLLNNSRKLTETTKQYLKNLKDLGYIIVIATGRIYVSALDATDGAEFANYIITDTGSCTYKVTGEIVFQNLIEKETIEKLFQYYNQDFCYIDVCGKNLIYRYSKTGVENGACIKIVNNQRDIFKQNLEVSHVSIVMNTNEAVLELYEKLIHDFPELDILIMQNSFKDNQWIEMTTKGCSKYRAIKKLADYLGIQNEQILAFGDGLNDIDMIENCGYGVALQNALPEVKKVAKDITSLDNNHNGVIDYLKNIIKRVD